MRFLLGNKKRINGELSVLSGHIALKFCSVKYANFLVHKPTNIYFETTMIFFTLHENSTLVLVVAFVLPTES